MCISFTIRHLNKYWLKQCIKLYIIINEIKKIKIYTKTIWKITVAPTNILRKPKYLVSSAIE